MLYKRYILLHLARRRKAKWDAANSRLWLTGGDRRCKMRTTAKAQNKGTLVVPEEKPEMVVSVKEFFECVPPGRWAKVGDLATRAKERYATNHHADLPLLDLHCSTELCSGVRFFAPESTFYFTPKERNAAFVGYRCRNCQKTVKTYAIWSFVSENVKYGDFYKLGEYPPFGPPTPSRLISLIGPDRECFLKGRRAENQGLGIAAFAYYRRVVENQKNRILDEIIKVCKQLSVESELVDDLLRAKDETQFSAAVEAVKHGIPQALLIKGHNPLTLLHSALSEGLHNQTDEQCLQRATDIRVVMAELAERLSETLKDNAELNTALTRLLNRGTPANDPPEDD